MVFSIQTTLVTRRMSRMIRSNQRNVRLFNYYVRLQRDWNIDRQAWQAEPAEQTRRRRRGSVQIEMSINIEQPQPRVRNRRNSIAVCSGIAPRADNPTQNHEANDQVVAQNANAIGLNVIASVNG